ncbi:helix-turn-helix domain-containing protein [Kurthia huakuii]|uniref:helix-turn-helix domain-containing protein n=1 Tax=Kurthia huakuii TaxID=1421019 RepID=UPI000496547D|nr:helix-turn-helix transcriptional regulator [Kurthia huakuii]MBM7700873.1 transcriptional regulator with XRE-family HTH domain [Kurthia huakuii]
MNLQFSTIFTTRRKELNMTQEQVAQYIGVSRAAVSKWEKGQSYPDITILPKLATYFNLSIDTLLGYEPQLTNERIIALYKELSTAFHEQPFHEAEVAVEALIHDYYSCFPFLLKMAQLYLNYAALADNPVTIAVRIEQLCLRVEQYSDDFDSLNEARMIGSLALLMQQRASDVLEKIGNRVQIQFNEDQVISRAHQLLGNIEQATEILQASTYQHLFLVISTCTDSLLLEEATHFDETIKRVTQLIDTWNIQALNPNTSLVFYLTAATGYMQQQKHDEAIVMLKEYAKACTKLSFPLQLCGDTYFNLINHWLHSTMQLATVTPRDEASVRRDIVSSITQHPAFAPLHERDDYKLLVQTIHHTLERES